MCTVSEFLVQHCGSREGLPLETTIRWARLVDPGFPAASGLSLGVSVGVSIGPVIVSINPGIFRHDSGASTADRASYQ
jgi:hypothetical protein